MAQYSGDDTRAKFTSSIPFILPIYVFGYSRMEKPIDILLFVFARRGAVVSYLDYLDIHVFKQTICIGLPLDYQG
jgi:hypothetical protein